jgi:lipid-A-disaccharide synthase
MTTCKASLHQPEPYNMSKIRTAVIGVGYLGKYHAQKYHQISNADLVAVCDIDPQQCQQIAHECDTEAVTDYTALLGRVDAVSIATPTPQHYRIAHFFLSNGVHVLIEKPITTTIEEADTLIALAKAHHLILQVGHLERFNNAVKAVEPALTDPRFIESTRLAPYQCRGTDVNVILDLMIHDIDIIQSMVKSNIRHIAANGVTVLSDFIDIANARIEFENGCVANVTASRVSLKTERKLRLFQEQGYISMDLDNKVIASYKKGEKNTKTGIPHIIREEKHYNKSDALYEQILAFLDCIAHGKTPLVDGEVGKRALATAIEITHIARQTTTPKQPASKKTAVCMVAGEASGDLLGAELARALHEKDPDLRLIGMGGSQMAEANVKLVVNAEKSLMLMGFVDVLKNINAIRRAMKTLIHTLKTERPALLILIDYPGFNLRLAKKAKQLGIKVLYYSCPQIWAWHYRRIKKIKRDVDHMAVLFPFEKTLYDRENMPATFVGHPLIDRIQTTKNSDALMARYPHLNAHPIIALLPGSRLSEIKALLPPMIAAAQRILATLPEAQFILPIAPNLSKAVIAPYLNNLPCIAEHDAHALLPHANAAMVTSGTATLEVALHAIPMVILYKANWLNYCIARLLINVRAIGLCNLITDNTVAKELIQHHVTPDNIATEILRLLNDLPYRDAAIQNMARMKAALGEGGGAKKVAELVFSLGVKSCLQSAE